MIALWSRGMVFRRLDIKNLTKIPNKCYNNANKTYPKISTQITLTHNTIQNHLISLSKSCSTNAIEKKLSESLTPQQEEELTLIRVENLEDNVKLMLNNYNNSTAPKISTRKKFKIQTIINEIKYLENAGFPLPSSLKNSQWEDLLRFEHRDSRVLYFDCLEQCTLDEDKKNDLFREDLLLCGQIIFPAGYVDNIIAGGDQKKIKKLDEIKYVYEKLWQSGNPVHPYIKEIDMDSMMDRDANETQIRKTLNFVLAKHDATMRDFIKKRSRQASAEVLKQKHNEKKYAGDHIIYGLGENSIILRTYAKTERWPDTNKTIREFNEWGQPLVIDLAFMKEMNYQQVHSLLYREIPHALNFNTQSPEPFAIYLTSYDPNCKKASLLQKAVQKVFDDDSTVIVTEKSYSELFSQDKLLYLTPDSKQDLLYYDPEDVYIIGGIVDTGGDSIHPKPHTLSAAKRQRIRHARLPMRRTIGVTKELNVDHVVAIMADYKFSKDWFYSFRWIPSRVFRNRLKAPGGYTPRMEAVYKAHKALSPSVVDVEKYGNEVTLHSLVTMPPHEYRHKYRELVEDWVENTKPDYSDGTCDNSKYMWKRKEQYTERIKGEI